MGLRNLSNISFPQQGQPTQAPMSRLGGGKGTFGSFPQQANPQSMMLQKLLPLLLARRSQQMQQSQAPAFLTPAQRLAQMPQQALPALTQAAPQPFFGAQPTAQAPTLPGMQAQQAYQTQQTQPIVQTGTPQENALASNLSGYDLTKLPELYRNTIQNQIASGQAYANYGIGRGDENAPAFLDYALAGSGISPRSILRG